MRRLAEAGRGAHARGGRGLGLGLSFALAPLAPALAATDPTSNCSRLTSLALADTTIVSATAVLDPGAAAQGSGIAPNLPAFCRVVARVREVRESDVGVEVWLPLSDWAGVVHGTGNGGFGGTLQSGYGAMAAGLRRGFASATTDTGTAPAVQLDGDALVNSPRKWRDWGRLSTHAMTVTAKAIATAFYRRPPERAYYTGCSTGGQQGLIEALYYPQDYDGILVGAPVINRTWGHAAVAWNFAAAHSSAGARLSEDKLALINRAALKACAAKGFGLADDPFIADALACRFDPRTLICKPGEDGACLTSAEAATARAFYTGPTAPDGKPLFHGWLPGSEIPGRFGWSFLQTNANGGPQFASLFRWVYGPDWDWRSFNPARDMAAVEVRLDPIVNDAVRGSLAAFKKRGGKLIVYHGLADTLVPPGQSVDFYRRHERLAGGAAAMRSFARLFLAPGMMHCAGGTGPDVLNSASGGVRPPVGGAANDLFDALIAWDRRGIAPDRVVATRYEDPARGTIALQRPVCAFPAQARYDGSGSKDAASSFTCAVPRGR